MALRVRGKTVTQHAVMARLATKEVQEPHMVQAVLMTPQVELLVEHKMALSTPPRFHDNATTSE